MARKFRLSPRPKCSGKHKKRPGLRSDAARQPEPTVAKVEVEKVNIWFPFRKAFAVKSAKRVRGSGPEQGPVHLRRSFKEKEQIALKNAQAADQATGISVVGTPSGADFRYLTTGFQLCPGEAAGRQRPGSRSSSSSW
jgi:hypothetical protein